MNAGILIACVVVLAACAYPTEQQIEDREYRDAEWRARFLEYRRDCRAKKGHIEIHGWTELMGHDGIPRYGDFYKCTKSLSIR